MQVQVNFEFAYQVNIIGVMTGTEIALERMKKVSLYTFSPNIWQPNEWLQNPKKGTIVNTASMAGIMTGSTNQRYEKS